MSKVFFLGLVRKFLKLMTATAHVRSLLKLAPRVYVCTLGRKLLFLTKVFAVCS